MTKNIGGNFDYIEEDEDFDEYEEFCLATGYGAGTAKGGTMFNPIGFGKPQDERIDLHIKYLATDTEINLLMYIEIDGERLYLQPFGNKKKDWLQFAKAFYYKFGESRYEQ